MKYKVTIEKKKIFEIEIEIEGNKIDSDNAMDLVEEWIAKNGEPDYSHDYTIHTEDGELLVDWSD